ncbi:MAG TPA: HEAT repeat domain-containing protein, partial [Bryobacteraceae bacterium]|nr:HEAT repeat domain-containing protein [Bryobacteraceae bacterium]
PAALAKLLLDPRPAVRDRAIEKLVSAGDDAVDALVSVRAEAEARAAAVFALYRIGTLKSARAVRAALNDADFRVRTAAARCAGMSADHAAGDRLMEMVKKDHPAVRRQAAAALGQLGEVRAAGALIAAAADAPDRFVEHSIIYSLITLGQVEPLRAALRQPAPKIRKAALIALDQIDGSPLRREEAVPLAGSKDRELRAAALFAVSHHPGWAADVLQELELRVRERNFDEAGSEGLKDAWLAFMPDEGARKRIADLLHDDSLGERQALFVLDTIDAAALKQFPAEWTDGVGALFDSPSRTVRLRALDLARAHALAGLDSRLVRIGNDAAAPDTVRMAALAALAPRLDGEQYTFLISKLSPKADAILRQTAAQTLARSAPPKSDLLLLARQRLPQADPLTLSTVLECFRSSHDQEVGAALVQLLKKSPAALGTLGEDRVKTLLSGYPDSVRDESAPLLQSLRAAEKVRIDRLRKLEPLLTAGGDAGRGRRIFFGETVACYSCHTIGREGGHVGPDLTGIGAIRSGHDLLEAIVFPSASFVPGHEVYNVDTDTERISGVMRRQTADAVTLVTGPNGEIRIPRSRIRKIARSNVSLMPEGFDESLNKTELTDLLAFLQAEKTRPK